MADVTYRIIVEGLGGGSDAPKTTAATPTGEEVSPKPAPASSSGGGEKSLYGAIKGSAAVGIALKYANLAITTEINRVELRTGRATYQAELNYQKSAITRAIGIGASLVGAVATGNPLLAVGGVVSAVDWISEVSISQENINIARAVNNVTVGMANIRAGAGGDRYGKVY